MKAINVWRAVCRRNLCLEKLLYEAYLYAEVHTTTAKLLDLIDDVEIKKEVTDPVVVNYVIDVLAGRCNSS